MKRKCLKCGSEMQLLSIEKDYRTSFGVIRTWMCTKCHRLSRQWISDFDYSDTVTTNSAKETKHE